MGNLIMSVVLLLRRARRCSKVLPCSFSVTMELLVLQYFFSVLWNSIGFLRVFRVPQGPPGFLWSICIFKGCLGFFRVPGYSFSQCTKGYQGTLELLTFEPFGSLMVTSRILKLLEILLCFTQPCPAYGTEGSSVLFRFIHYSKILP